MNRRSFLKYTLSTLSVIAASGGLYYYAHKIEPASLHVKRNDIHSKNIPTAFHDFKVVQISDTHLGFQYTVKQFKQMCIEVNKLNPDIVVFTGDLIDKPHTFKTDPTMIDALHSIKTNHGKFWVYGNHDHGGNGTKQITDLMDRADFKLVNNSHSAIKINNEQIIVAGIDDASLGKPSLEEAFQHVDQDDFSILLSHAPDYADFAKDFPVDVQLSGHSHGGQVRLPFIGHLYTPKYAKKYVNGAYDITDRLKLIVSKGIGTTRMPFRFLCKPEINVVTLKRQK
ncbi:MAG TPA: metallophosphoesterase [Bacillota bacterium]|nr:metallophosphoesterase [Bacillota bacterium]